MSKKEKTEKKTKKEHNFYLLLWINAVICTTIITLLLTPQSQQLVHRSKQLIEVEAQAQSLEDVYYSRVRSAQNLIQLQDGSILDQSLLHKDNVITFIQVFEDAALKADVSQRVDLQSRQQTASGDIISVPTKIQVIGSWEGIIEFLTVIEQADFYINPSLLEIAPYMVEDDEYELTIQTNTFWIS